MKLRTALVTALVLASVSFAGVPALATEAPPVYQLQFLGEGTPVAISDTGVVAGRRLISGTSNYVPLVSVGGAQWAALPAPPNAMSVFPTGVNDAGVIVGVSFSTNWNPVALRWTPRGGGYLLEELPRIPGDSSSYATGINNLGEIVGSRRTLGYSPTGSGWLYSDSGGVDDLAARYGWWSWPGAINDIGQIIGGAERLDLSTGAVTWIGAGPAEYQAITAVGINNSGRMVGHAALRSTSLNVRAVFRSDPAANWEYIDGSSRYAFASDINDLGDVTYRERGTGLYLDGLGKYGLYELLNPAVTSAGWTIGTGGAVINNQRVVAASASNSLTGQSGGVLLTPSGTLPAPTAPAGLTAVPHPATMSEPYNSIDLTWQNTSVLTQGYELERRVSGAGVWTRLALTPPGTATKHTDTTVDTGVTYDYRVRATGLGGASPWSAIASATSPSTPPDTTPPVVAILSPAGGSPVSGTITVTASASDNVGVKYLEISFWNHHSGQRVVLGSVMDSGSLSVPWNTAGLTPDAYTLRAYAYDALGNWSEALVVVNVGTATQVMRVSSIALSSRVKGSKATVTGSVDVRDSAGAAVPGAAISVRWTLPDGTQRTATATTDSTGRARFSISASRGTYVLAVTGVSKSGHTYDADGSVLSRSHTTR